MGMGLHTFRTGMQRTAAREAREEIKNLINKFETFLLVKARIFYFDPLSFLYVSLNT